MDFICLLFFIAIVAVWRDCLDGSFHPWISFPFLSHLWCFTPQMGMDSFCSFNSPITSGFFASELKMFDYSLTINSLGIYHILLGHYTLCPAGFVMQTLLAKTILAIILLFLIPCSGISLLLLLDHIIIKLLNPNLQSDINSWSFELHF